MQTQARQAVLALALAGVVGVAAQGCSFSCTLIGCDDGIFVSAVVHRPVDEVASAAITTCYNNDCKTQRPLDSLDRARRWKNGTLFDGGEGWTRMALVVHSPETPREDGDVVRVAVVAPDGKPIMKVERALTINPRPNPNGESCGDDCRYANVTLFENSPSGLKCGNGAVGALVQVEVLLRSIEGYVARNAKLTVCRNTVCSTSAKTLESNDNTLEGDLVGTLSRSSTSLVVRLSPLPPQLTDTDRYSVSVVDGATNEVLFAREEPADYETSFPNSAECDVYPSRQATIRFQ